MFRIRPKARAETFSAQMLLDLLLGNKDGKKPGTEKSEQEIRGHLAKSIPDLK